VSERQASGGPDRSEGTRGRMTRDTFKDSRVAVVGLGYVGLPLAIAFAEAGLEVEGIDASPERVEQLRQGRSPIDDISDERLAAALAGRLRIAGTNEARPGDADAAFVCVPTPITATKDPDLGPVLQAAGYLRDHLRPGQLVVLQSTTFPGTTMGPFRSVLEERGCRAGEDFDLAFAPERVNPGDPMSASRDIPRLVGGSTPRATGRAAALLGLINDRVVELSSPDAAEMAKLLENVFRNVNIAFVNNLALLCERMNLDVWEVIDAAATKPFGFMRFTPGPGVGGHCIPVDPYYLSWRARAFDFFDRFIELAGDINFSMPRHVVDLVADGLNEHGHAVKGARVGVIGVAFKPDVQDGRNSPAAAVIAGLVAHGAEVRYHDPYVARFQDEAGAEFTGEELDPLLDWADAIVVVTAHKAIDWDRVYLRARLVVDTVNSSAGRRVRPRQVLRLGAGWSAEEQEVHRPALTGRRRAARGSLAALNGQGARPAARTAPGTGDRSAPRSETLQPTPEPVAQAARGERDPRAARPAQPRGRPRPRRGTPRRSRPG
jgi:UDP-N-acetyl-D-glucosamine dehydrogenase